MTNFLGITTILSLILAAGSIEDCSGACIGNENWTAFFICLTIALICGILTISTLKKGDKTMIKVEKTANTLDEGIKNLMAGAKLDYQRWSEKDDGMSSWSKEQIANWDSKTKIKEGKKYIKIVQDTGVFCFIVKEDFKHFKKGDVLKAAGWNAPALNSARGNVLAGNYPIQWTGPLYLK